MTELVTATPLEGFTIEQRRRMAPGTTLTDWLWLREGWTGAPTETPSGDGNAA